MTAALLIIATVGWLWGLAEWVRANAAEDQRDDARADRDYWRAKSVQAAVTLARRQVHPATRQIAERPRLEVVRGEGL